MLLTKPASSCCCCLLAALLLSLSAAAQDPTPKPASSRVNPLIHLSDFHLTGIRIKERHDSAAIPPARRWILSFNPFGLIELPMAIGAGIGYRLNPSFELWSETSLISKGLFSSIGSIGGFRQILQAKWFVGKQNDFFFAAEARFKSWSFSDTANFYGHAMGDTLHEAFYHDHRYFWGLGAQIGTRRKLTKDGRLQLELTIGAGFKYKYIDRSGVGSGYAIMDHAIDLNARDFLDSKGPSVYFPGSLRIIYTLGKRIL